MLRIRNGYDRTDVTVPPSSFLIHPSSFLPATVTYDFARQMDGAEEVKCSQFGDAVIAKM